MCLYGMSERMSECLYSTQRVWTPFSRLSCLYFARHSKRQNRHLITPFCGNSRNWEKACVWVKGLYAWDPKLFENSVGCALAGSWDVRHVLAFQAFAYHGAYRRKKDACAVPEGLGLYAVELIHTWYYFVIIEAQPYLAKIHGYVKIIAQAWFRDDSAAPYNLP